MSNIDGDDLEFDDLNMPSDLDSPIDGMPDPTTDKPAAEPTIDENIEPLDGSVRESVSEKDKTDAPVAAKKDGLLSMAMQASPYTIMLAISVLAIGVALICLLLEWGTYDFQRKPTMGRVDTFQLPAVSMPADTVYEQSMIG